VTPAASAASEAAPPSRSAAATCTLPRSAAVASAVQPLSSSRLSRVGAAPARSNLATSLAPDASDGSPGTGSASMISGVHPSGLANVGSAPAPSRSSTAFSCRCISARSSGVLLKKKALASAAASTSAAIASRSLASVAQNRLTSRQRGLAVVSPCAGRKVHRAAIHISEPSASLDSMCTLRASVRLSGGTYSTVPARTLNASDLALVSVTTMPGFSRARSASHMTTSRASSVAALATLSVRPSALASVSTLRSTKDATKASKAPSTDSGDATMRATTRSACRLEGHDALRVPPRGPRRAPRAA